MVALALWCAALAAAAGFEPLTSRSGTTRGGLEGAAWRKAFYATYAAEVAKHGSDRVDTPFATQQQQSLRNAIVSLMQNIPLGGAKFLPECNLAHVTDSELDSQRFRAEFQSVQRPLLVVGLHRPEVARAFTLKVSRGERESVCM
jgi:hypothetical protein